MPAVNQSIALWMIALPLAFSGCEIPLRYVESSSSGSSMAAIPTGTQQSATGCLAADCHVSPAPPNPIGTHQPFGDGTCDACHTLRPEHPEGSAPHVDAEADIVICFDCHTPSELGNSHPVDAGAIDPKTGGLLTCTSTCHDPHAAQYPRLLRYAPGDGLCLMCHKENLP